MTRDDDADAADEADSDGSGTSHGGALADGGAAGADDVVLDPWGSATVDDYAGLFAEFGIEAFDEVLPDVPDPPYLMRPSIIFGQPNQPQQGDSHNH